MKIPLKGLEEVGFFLCVFERSLFISLFDKKISKTVILGKIITI